MSCHWLGASQEDSDIHPDVATEAEVAAAGAATSGNLSAHLAGAAPAADQKKLNGQMESESWEEAQLAVFFQRFQG